MADGPDFQQMQAQQLAMNSLRMSSQGGGGSGGVCGGILRDVDFGSNLSLKVAALKSDGTFQPRAAVRPGMVGKAKSSMNLSLASIADQIKECMKLPVQQVNSLADITGHGLPGGYAQIAAGGAPGAPFVDNGGPSVG